MRKNKMMRLASGLLVAVLLTTSMISGTFAKYTSTKSGSDSARVAKWSIIANGTEDITLADPATITFDLFGTIEDTAAPSETDVKNLSDPADGKTVIAPGTKGSFELTVQNKSEVNAIYTITLAESNDDEIPLKYSVDGENWVDSIEALSMTALTNVAINMEAAASTQTVYWKWVFDNEVPDAGGHIGQTNASDTALGVGAQNTPAEVTITATITATQVD